jgi:hypothetical protein
MADGFIVRRGGKAEEVLRTATPDINFVSKTNSQIVVTFKNNDATEADVFYGLTSPLTTKVTLATNTTSSNITFSGLDPSTQYTISAYAIVTDATLKKIKSEVVSTNITTDTPVYTAATGGTTEEYDSGGKRYKSHTFTSGGNFIVSTVGDAAGDLNKVDFLVVAGGAGGGRGADAGGGGAGGYQTSLGTSGADTSALSKITVTAKTYGIDVGSGGTGSNTLGVKGGNGTNSVFDTIVSLGGGGGGSQLTADGTSQGANGGSGGGSITNQTSVGQGTSGQGRNGGQGSTTGTTLAGGGGGGASNVGANGSDNTGGNGGNGLANLLRTGSNETRAGGGGGAGRTATRASGGAGGGGLGGIAGTLGTAGATNTGGGGGGGGAAGSEAGQNGGSGIVIIRYEIAPSV